MSTKRLLRVLCQPLFLSSTAGGIVLAILIVCLAPRAVQIASVIVLLFVVIGLLITAINALVKLPDDVDDFTMPLFLARDKEVFELYRSIANSLRDVSANPDQIYRELAVERTGQMVGELAEVSNGHIIFTGTETWRLAYERVLRSPGLHNYRSISHVKTSNYWQDEPGRRSMQVNFELQDGGTLNIERIAIFPDHLWPSTEGFPLDPLQRWVEEQHNHGIWITLVRESDIADETDLLVDMGIYGNRAVGIQELDDHSRTVRFTLSFDFAEVLAAEGRWDRLSVYAIPYRKLLDQLSSDV